MKIKNESIVALVFNGANNITATELVPAQAYRVIKFRRALNAAFEKVRDAEKTLLEENHLKVNDKGEIEGKEVDRKKFVELRVELYKDEAELDCKVIPFDEWCKLKKENKVLSNPAIEDTLEGVLWEAPAEE